VNLLRGLAQLAPQKRGTRAARKLAQIVAAKSSPACPGLTPSPQLPRIGSPSRKRRTEDGIAMGCSTVTPDCQELDCHDTRTDTRQRDPPRVHPALQCLPTRTQTPSIAARRPAAQPHSAPLTGRDDSQGRRGALLAPGALPRCGARGRSVMSLSSAWCRAACCLPQQRFDFKSWRCGFKINFVSVRTIKG
jgi:hypothetical protein